MVSYISISCNFIIKNYVNRKITSYIFLWNRQHRQDEQKTPQHNMFWTPLCANDVNKTCALLQTAGGRKEPNIVSSLKQQSRTDMSSHSDTLSWLCANQSSLFPLDAVCFAEKQQIPIFILNSSLRKFYSRPHDLVDHFGISVSQNITDMFHLS